MSEVTEIIIISVMVVGFTWIFSDSFGHVKTLLSFFVLFSGLFYGLRWWGYSRGDSIGLAVVGYLLVLTGMMGQKWMQEREEKKNYEG